MNRQRSSYEDLIFENRNKSYGAYDLRVNYQTNLMKSFFVGIGGLTLVALIVYQINRYEKPKTIKIPKTDILDMSKIFSTEKFDVIQNKPSVASQKSTTITAVKTIADPLSFKVVSKVIEPVKADPQPTIAEPITGLTAAAGLSSEPFTGTATIGTIGTGIQPEIFSTATVDKLPEFPGGMEGFYNFLAKNVRFPEQARQERISGKLFVSFVIDIEGKLVEIEFIRKAGYGMEESVASVLSRSPKWSPGLVKDQQVNTKMILPVSFNLVQ